MFPIRALRVAKATETAVQAVRPLIDRVTFFAEVKPSVWFDPYVLGFIIMTAVFFAQGSSRKALKQEDIGYVMLDVYKLFPVSNQDALVEAAIKYETTQDSEFKRGMHAANKCIATAYGRPPVDDRDVEAAREQVGRLSDDAELAGALQYLLFDAVVRKLNRQ